MAQFNPVIGKATNVLWIDPDGVEVSMSKIMSWTFKFDSEKLKSIGLDGNREVAVIYEGLSGSFSAELTDRGVYDFFMARMNEFTQSSNSRYSTFVAYLTYQGGSVQALTFNNVAATFDEAGEFKYNDTVKLKVSWEAQSAVGL